MTHTLQQLGLLLLLGGMGCLHFLRLAEEALALLTELAMDPGYFILVALFHCGVAVTLLGKLLLERLDA
jgi:hypothetical protein